MVKLQTINLKQFSHILNNYVFYLYLSIFIFLIFLIFKNNEINPDGILYLSQAYKLSSHGYSSFFELNPKSIFVILIAFISNLLSVSLYTSAKIINLFFLVTAIYFYLLHIKLLYEGNKNILIGLFLIFCCSTIFDSYAGMIIRDHGFWALSMIGSYCFLKYCQTYKIKYSLLYQLMFAASILFRQEGILFLILLPLLPIYKNFKFSVVFKNYSFILLFIFILILSVVFNFGVFSNQIINFNSFFLEKLITFFSNFINNIPMYSDNEHIDFLLKKYNFLITFYLLFILCFYIIKSFGLVDFLLFFYMYKTKIYKKIKINKILYLLLSIGIVSIFLQFFYVYVISGRYLVILWWWFYILLTPYATTLFFDSKSLFFKYCFIFIVIIGFFDNFIDKNEKFSQEKNMANFILSNNLIDEIEFVDTNRIHFYSYENDDKFFESSKVSSKKYLLIKKDDYHNYYKDNDVQHTSSNQNPLYYLITK